MGDLRSKILMWGGIGLLALLSTMLTSYISKTRSLETALTEKSKELVTAQTELKREKISAEERLRSAKRDVETFKRKRALRDGEGNLVLISGLPVFDEEEGTRDSSEEFSEERKRHEERESSLTSQLKQVETEKQELLKKISKSGFKPYAVSLNVTAPMTKFDEYRFWPGGGFSFMLGPFETTAVVSVGLPKSAIPDWTVEQTGAGLQVLTRF